MRDTSKPFFLQVVDESETRVLHPVKVLSFNDNQYTCECGDNEKLPLKENDATFIFWEDGRTFMQQSALVVSIAEDESGIEIVLDATGEPVSGESRGCYRVSTVILGLTVAVNDEKECPLLDVSVSGMSATTASRHKLGDRITVALSYEGREFGGTVVVHSVRELHTGRFRHGFNCMQDRRCNGNLQKGMQLVNTSVQRLLIQRMARA